MNAKRTRYIFIIAVIMIVSNVSLLNVVFDVFANANDVSYSNDNGTFTFEEINFNRRDFEMCRRRWQNYKQTNLKDNTTLYRITKKNYLQFWMWHTYVTDDRFKLPYKDWDSISDKRHVVSDKSSLQDF